MAQPTIRSNVHPPGNENFDHNILFDQHSDSLLSHTITVQTEPWRIMAFGLQGNQYIEVEQVIGTGSGLEFQAFAPAGVPYRLTSNTSSLVLEWAGRYRFRLVEDEEIEGSALGTVKAIGYRFSMTHEWNYILAQSLRELLDRLNLSVEDTTTVDLTLTFDGVNGQQLTADVNVSADTDNQMTIEADGLKARAYVEAGTGITVTGVGTEADPYVVANLCCEEGEVTALGARLCVAIHAEGAVYADCDWVCTFEGCGIGPLVSFVISDVTFGTPPYTVSWPGAIGTLVLISASEATNEDETLTPTLAYDYTSTTLNSSSDTFALTFSHSGMFGSKSGVYQYEEDVNLIYEVTSAVNFTITDSLGETVTLYVPETDDTGNYCGSLSSLHGGANDIRKVLVVGKNTQNCGDIGTTQSLEVCVEPSSGTSDAGFSSPGTSLPDITLTDYSHAQTRFTVYVPVGNQTYDTAGPHEIDFSNVTVSATWSSTFPDAGSCTVFSRNVSAVGGAASVVGEVVTVTTLSSLNTAYLAVTMQLPASAPLDVDYQVTVLVDGYVQLRALGNSVTTNHYIPTGNAATIVCDDYTTNPGSAYTDVFDITGVVAPGALTGEVCVSPGTYGDIDLSAENIATTERTLTVSVNGIAGGTAPYSVSFTNVAFTGTCLEGATNRLTGITESSNTVSGVLEGGSATCTATLDVDTGAYNVTQNGTASIGIASGSYVTITDAAAATLTLYIPSSVDNPGAEVCGTVLVDPVDAYLDSWNITGTGGGGGPTDPLGVGSGGGLFLGPTAGYPYEYYPGWYDTDIKYPGPGFTYPVNRCVPGNQDSMYRVPVFAVIKNITGGVPPYTVDFSGLTFTFIIDQYDEFPSCVVNYGIEPAVTTTYSGYTGAANNPIRTNVPLGHTELRATPDQGSLVGYITSLSNLGMHWEVTGSVVVTDSAAQSLTFNIPTASEGALGAIAPGGSSGTYTDVYTHFACNPSETPCP